jgi:hypothetical protein
MLWRGNSRHSSRLQIARRKWLWGWWEKACECARAAWECSCSGVSVTSDTGPVVEAPAREPRAVSLMAFDVGATLMAHSQRRGD